MSSFPTYPGLDTAIAFVLALLYLLCGSALALVIGAVWRRRSPSARAPTIILRIAFAVSLLVFSATFFMFVYALASGFYRGALDFFSMAFWPCTCAAIAFLAMRQLGPSTSSADARNS